MRKLIGPVAVLLLPLLAFGGCYTLVPMTVSTFTPGQLVSLEITDAGRMALGGVMGPEIGTIDGRVYEASADEVEVAVTGIKLIRGGDQVWKGERIKIRNEFISRRYERQFSRGRTIVASAVGASVVVYLLSRSIFVKATQGETGKVPGDTAHSLRRPVRP